MGTDAGARENRRKVPTKVVVKAQLKPDLQDGTGSMPIGPVVLPECVCVCVCFFRLLRPFLLGNRGWLIL